MMVSTPPKVPVVTVSPEFDSVTVKPSVWFDRFTVTAELLPVTVTFSTFNRFTSAAGV